MRAVFGLVLIIGMGLAGFAVFMVKGYMSDQQAALAQERARAQQIVETVDVVAVTEALGYGDVLTEDNVAIIKHTKEFLPEGAFATLEELFPEGSEGERVLVQPLLVNEPVLVDKLTDIGQTAGITNMLRPQMRAVTINVDVSSGVSGFLRPGSFVDIYWSGDVNGLIDGRSGQGNTYLIGESVELIAVDQSTDRNRAVDRVPSTVTVQVSQLDVKSLTWAQEAGKLSLALVGSDWADKRSPDGVAAITLPEPEEAPVVVADAPPPPPEVVEECFTHLRRGTERVAIPVACSD